MPRFGFVDAWAFSTLFNIVLIILIILINVVNVVISIYVISGLAFAIILAIVIFIIIVIKVVTITRLINLVIEVELSRWMPSLSILTISRHINLTFSIIILRLRSCLMIQYLCYLLLPLHAIGQPTRVRSISVLGMITILERLADILSELVQLAIINRRFVGHEWCWRG